MSAKRKSFIIMSHNTKELTMNIAICDDDNVIRNLVKRECINYYEDKDIDYKLYTYGSGEELTVSNNDIDLIFLDMEMGGMNGIEVAKLLRKKRPDIEIVYLTSHTEYMQQAFEVRACRYLIKNKDMKNITCVLDQIHKEISNNRDIIIKSDGRNHIVKENSIFYIKALGDYSVVYLENSQIISGFTLKEWTSKLSVNKCYQVHKSYIVFFSWIKSYDNKGIALEDGSVIPIARRKIQEFNKRYEDYIITINR